MAFAHYEYTVRSGDSPGRIIYDMYGWTPVRQPATYKATLNGVLAMNPHITDPERIHAGQILRLPADPASASLRHVRPIILRQQGFATDSIPSSEREYVSTIAWIAHHSNWLTVPGSVAAGTAAGVLGGGNQQLLTQIGNLYAQYKAGRLTKGQYDSRRARVVQEIRRNLGPLEKIFRPNLRGSAWVTPIDRLEREGRRW